MLLWYLFMIIGFVALVFASVVDIKIREVPNWLSYSLIVIGLGVRLIYSLMISDFSYIIYGLVGFGVFFALANLMYYTKQWGGGDSKLLMGLGAMFGNFWEISLLGFSYELPFLVSLLVNIFVAGTVYGLIYSIFLALKHKKEFLKEFKLRKFNELKIVSLIIFLLLIISLLVIDERFLGLVLVFLLLILFACLVLSFMKIVEDISLYKTIDVNKLVEGDWLAKDVVVGKRTICHMRNIGVTRGDISLLKRNKIKRVFVKEGIPFVPSFLIGFLFTIFFSDVISLLI